MKAIRELFASKKFLATLIACITWLVGKVGLHATDEQIGPVVALLATFVLGQGVADIGKPAAEKQIAADAAAANGIATSPVKPPAKLAPL